MNQEELILRMYDHKHGWSASPNDRKDKFGTPCFPMFRPYVKPEYPGIKQVVHGGSSCQDSIFHCFLEFTDGRIQEMSPHPPGECPWCDYLRFDVEDL